MSQGTLQYKDAVVNVTSVMVRVLLVAGVIILLAELSLLLIYAIRKKGKEKIIETAKFWTPLGVMALIVGATIGLFLDSYTNPFPNFRSHKPYYGILLIIYIIWISLEVRIQELCKKLDKIDPDTEQKR